MIDGHWENECQQFICCTAYRRFHRHMAGQRPISWTRDTGCAEPDIDGDASGYQQKTRGCGDRDPQSQTVPLPCGPDPVFLLGKSHGTERSKKGTGAAGTG